MKKLVILLVIIISTQMSMNAQKRTVALEKSNPTEFKNKLDKLKKDPEEEKIKIEKTIAKDTSTKISAFEKSSRRERKKMDPSSISNENKDGLGNNKEVVTAKKRSDTDSTQGSSQTNSSSEISFSSSTKASTPSISNSSAIANGQSNSNSPAVARVLKYKADEKSVEYYNQLREKFEAEEKIRLEKDASEKIINAKKEEEARQARHLSEDQAPQFDKYRNGATNTEDKKTTVEEDFNKLFK